MLAALCCGGKSQMSEEFDPKAQTRRTLLRFGAAALPAVATLRASPAAAAASVLTCRVPLAMSNTGSKWIRASDGALVAPGTYGSYGPLANSTPYYTGEELKAYAKGEAGRPISGKYMVKSTNGSTGSLTSTGFDAHYQYLERLGSNGGAGYTCYMSIVNNW